MDSFCSGRVGFVVGDEVNDKLRKLKWHGRRFIPCESCQEKLLSGEVTPSDLIKNRQSWIDSEDNGHNMLMDKASDFAEGLGQLP